MKKDTVEMLHKVYKVFEEKNDVELLAELKQFVKTVKHTECLLTRGGIIQDVNGSFLTAGDEVFYLKNEREMLTGKLLWIDNRFTVHCSDGNEYVAFSCNMVKK